MAELIVNLHLTGEYRLQIEKIREDPVLRKCRSWTDTAQIPGDRAEVALTDDGICLRFDGPKGPVREQCGYDAVLAVTERRDGVLLRLSHKRLLFLPVTKDPAENRRLMNAMLYLSGKCQYLFRKGRLRLPGVGLADRLYYHTRPKQGYDQSGAGPRGATLALICLSLFIATIFVRMPLENRRIDVTEAVEFSGRYDGCDPSYSRRSLRYIDLQFLEGGEQTVDSTCTGYGLLEKLEALPRGTRMDLLLHPDSGAVLRIEAEGACLLEFDFASQQLWNEAVAFAVMGVFLYGCAIWLLVALVRGKMEGL